MKKHDLIPFEDSFANLGNFSRAGFVIPFEIKKSKCVDLVRSWFKQLWFAPIDLVMSVILNANSFTCVFIPFWLFEVDADILYSPMSPLALSFTEDALPYGKISDSFNDLMICASDTPEAELIRGIGPWDLLQLQKSTLKHTEGVETWPFTTGEETAWQKAQLRLQQIGRDACQKKLNLTPSDIQNYVKISVNWTNRKAKRLFLPVYVATYNYKGKDYRVVINGSTGKVHGERPYGTGRMSFGAPKVVSAMGYLISKLRLDV